MVISIAIFPVVFAYTDYNTATLLSSLVFFPVENPSGLGVFPLLTVGWTLNFEMMFYTILSISIFLSRKNPLLACFTIILIFPIIWPDSFPFSRVLSSTLLYTFLAGFIIANVVVSKWFKYFLKYQIIFSLASFIVGLLCFKLFGVHAFFKILSASSFVFSAVLLNSYLNTNNRIVSHFIKLGDFSYSTYLIHVFVLGIALHYFGNELNYFLEITLIIGISTILYVSSKYSYLFLEQNKLVLWMKQYLLTSANKVNIAEGKHPPIK